MVLSLVISDLFFVLLTIGSLAVDESFLGLHFGLHFFIPQISYSTDFRPEDQPEDDAKPEETHQGATPGNRKLSFSPY